MTLIELKASGRFIRDAFLRVLFSNLSSSKVVHFVLAETNISKYCISSNKRAQHLLNFETVRCGTYYRVALGKLAMLKLAKPCQCHFSFQNKNEI